MPRPDPSSRERGRGETAGRAGPALLFAFSLSLLTACAFQGLSKAEYITRADELCRQFEQRSRNVSPRNDPFQPGASPADLQAAPRFLDHFAAGLPELAGDLRGLGPPEEDRQLLDRMLGILDESGAHFARAKIALQGGNHESAKASVQSAFGQLEQAAAAGQRYGFRRCGGRTVERAAAAPAPPGPEVPVTATEYAFAMPPETTPGPHTFVIRNDGKERHFMTLVRLKPGIPVSRVIDSEKAGEATDVLIEQNMGNSETALPGTTVRFNADLPPGNYGYACFIAAPDGQLHAYKGMIGQLVVKQP